MFSEIPATRVGGILLLADSSAVFACPSALPYRSIQEGAKPGLKKNIP
jgi:hypothetical protein